MQSLVVPATLQSLAFGAALTVLYAQNFDVSLEKMSHLSLNSCPVQNGYWLTAALLRRPLACLPVTMQKSPPMSSVPRASAEHDWLKPRK